ncbi:Thioredoxin [Metallosphaera sp. J1]|uniref:thioredoxin n=1 Tax=Metallosphaera TaxID=41980 RepID=UPI001EE031E9|nr:thioredoxin [Metallosphaera javensis (ex Hofmann et al. 2022)]MCG3109547.1 Thioredoxin [Metallosphaera javensis (ex Hofmann et al. 2022)]BCS94117.1 MAG: thiol reductase thioredoxin [Metallosphaera javensis (ex Sakai et al. 2022)]
MSELEQLAKEISERLKRKASSLERRSDEKIVAITDDGLEEILSKNKVVVIDFWAQWCAPCHLYEPVFKRVASKYGEKALFGRLNVDENPKTADKFGIMNIPTTLILVDGQVKETLVGAVDEDTLESALKKYI